MSVRPGNRRSQDSSELSVPRPSRKAGVVEPPRRHQPSRAAERIRLSSVPAPNSVSANSSGALFGSGSAGLGEL